MDEAASHPCSNFREAVTTSVDYHEVAAVAACFKISYYYAQIFVDAKTVTTDQSHILTATRFAISQMADGDDDCANDTYTNNIHVTSKYLNLITFFLHVVSIKAYNKADSYFFDLFN